MVSQADRNLQEIGTMHPFSRPKTGQAPSHPRRGRAAQRVQAQLRLERLEDRTLPSFGFGWAFHVEGTDSDTGNAIAVDGTGNVYVSGYFNGTNVNFDPLNPSPPPSAYLTGGGAFAAKYSPGGTLLWATPLVGGTFGYSGGITVQGSNVYVAYSPSTAGTVVKLDAGTGALGWTVSIPGSSRASAVAAGQASGNVYVTGSTTSSQALVAQVSASGVLQWKQTSSTTSDGIADGHGVAVDAPNSGPESVYVIGDYNRTVTFGATTLTSLGSTSNISYRDIFVWKLNSDSTPAGATSLGTSAPDQGFGITIDGGGNPYLTGQMGGIDKGGSTIFVAKLLPNLTPSWTSYFHVRGTGPGAGGTAVALDPAGNVYTTGEFSGTYDFDPGSGQYLLTSGKSGKGGDVFVSELDANGNFVAAADMHGTSNLISYGLGIAVDTASPANVYTTGYLAGTADFDPTSGTYNLTAAASNDIFVSKLTQSGTQLLAPSSTPPASAPSRDEALALLLVSENASDTSAINTGSGSREQTRSQPVLPGVPGTEMPSAKPTPTLASVLPQMTSTVPVDWLFADLGSGGWVDAFTAL
jgi:hypothetical protein